MFRRADIPASYLIQTDIRFKFPDEIRRRFRKKPSFSKIIIIRRLRNETRGFYRAHGNEIDRSSVV